MNANLMQGYESLPKAGSYRLLDFEWAEVAALESFPPQFLLRVGGTKPHANLSVDLSPLVYIRQPQYGDIGGRGRARAPARARVRARGADPTAHRVVGPSPLVYRRPPEYWDVEVGGRVRGGILVPG